MKLYGIVSEYIYVVFFYERIFNFYQIFMWVYDFPQRLITPVPKRAEVLAEARNPYSTNLFLSTAPKSLQFTQLLLNSQRKSIRLKKNSKLHFPSRGGMDSN